MIPSNILKIYLENNVSDFNEIFYARDNFHFKLFVDIDKRNEKYR